ncbi:MAG: metallophosphoesterase [Candidatus Micrarchaeota archaeon]
MRFLYDAPAILHEGALILGDTHFGMEEKLRRKGIFDDNFSMRLFEKLRGLVEEHKAKKVIFLGDVKEDITMLDKRTENILSRLSMICEVVVVRGNHDGGIESFRGAKIAPSEGIVHEGLGLLHGHSWPSDELMRCRYLAMGHQHPMVAISDAFGRKHSEPAWIIAPPEVEALAARYPQARKDIRLIMMPAFNPLVGSIMKTDDKSRLGPLLNNKLFKLSDALVVRLDGTRLGKLKNLI